MGLNESGLKAVTLVSKEKVVLEKATLTHLFIYVDGETVTYDKNRDIWRCGCVHESWRGNKPERCFHIKAAQIYIENLKKRGGTHNQDTD